MTPQQTIESDTTATPTFAEWIQANSRIVGVGAAVVVLAAVGYWFYLRSAEIKRQNADRGLNQAKQSISAGNAALAESDLQKVATRYKGTPAGAQAAMLLAQLNFDQGKTPQGLKVLEPYQSGSAAGANLGAIWALTADGQLGSGKPDDAAKSYEKAANATALPGEKSIYLSKSARALMLAGKNEDARKLWERLASDPNAMAVRNEAEVRLGELQARPAGKT